MPVENIDKGSWNRYVRWYAIEPAGCRRTSSYYENGRLTESWLLEFGLSHRPDNLRLNMTREQIIGLRNALNEALEKRLNALDPIAVPEDAEQLDASQ